jgi:hypothetical protein
VDLLKLLRSFEEFLFEAMTWLFFYPRTMLRIVQRPLAMMAYAEQEEGQPEGRRYDDGLSPPVLLIITLVLANAVAWAAHVPRPEGASPLAHAIFSSQQNLLLFRCLMFSLLPLVATLTLLRKQGQPVSRDTLRRPFYAQCYLAAPHALAVSLGGIGLQRHQPTLVGLGLAVTIAATVWLIVVQTRWFSENLTLGAARAAFMAIGAVTRSLLYLLVIVAPVVLL